MIVLFNNDRTVRFEEKKHQYFNDSTGDELTSVSRVIQSVSVPFDREGISRIMAKGDPEKQKEILAEWDAKKDSSIDRGNWIHDALEKYAIDGSIEPELKHVAKQVRPILKEAYRFFPEALIYSMHYRAAGQSDLVVQRQRSEKSVFDFYDYKTNESKGIEFDSVSRKKDPVNHYNRFLLPPLDHLEDCNYNKYALQLSIYAFMAQTTYGIKVGKLKILFIDNDLVLHQLPVPFLKMEAKALLEHHRNLKSIPEAIKISDPMTDLEMKKQNDWDDDW